MRMMLDIVSLSCLHQITKYLKGDVECASFYG